MLVSCTNVNNLLLKPQFKNFGELSFLLLTFEHLIAKQIALKSSFNVPINQSSLTTATSSYSMPDMILKLNRFVKFADLFSQTNLMDSMVYCRLVAGRLLEYNLPPKRI